ncbi:BREX-1 system adenine-specific DNA-methyltransferase PglX [Sinorhizobium fredii]|uniref:BREX-1 system adenine-specific DNA-methyltransferase PglX n=1 Tax=Rhizobium fredii TaxID=380 RepID=UPI00351375FC
MSATDIRPLTPSARRGLLAAYDVATACQGLATTDNDQFVRSWHEVPADRISFTSANAEEAIQSGCRWFPIDKGGPYRKWFGNNDYVVDWENDGSRIRNSIVQKYQYLNGNPDFVAKNPSKYFLPGVTWGKITSALFSARYSPRGSIFSDAGMKAFGKNQEEDLGIAGLLNSRVTPYFLSALSSTMNYEQGNISRIPIKKVNTDKIHLMVSLSEKDWDQFETSWNFKCSPLLTAGKQEGALAGRYKDLRSSWLQTTLVMQQLEESNNQRFIDAYGLSTELSPRVALEEVTLTCNPHHRYGADVSEEEQEARLRADTICELLSYSVGCTMGRYSLAELGLVYAGSGNRGFDQSRYGAFPVDDDAIVPVTEMEWFDDDAASRFEQFLKAAWPQESVRENLRFVAESLANNGAGDAREIIRSYFARGFFKDHLKTYKRRPIYWLFSSGKLKAFECLVYIHRYNESTLSRMRMEYVVPLQSRMAARIDQLGDDVSSASSSAARTKAQKEKDLLARQLEELRAFDEELRHYADQRIALDLDDGVKVNYGKFGNLLAERKAVTGEK